MFPAIKLKGIIANKTLKKLVLKKLNIEKKCINIRTVIFDYIMKLKKKINLSINFLKRACSSTG
tara:strand:+ start:1234 stop:1425 length:192 start_codon:yes stop_codon:yes gene_type:complete